MTATVRGTVRGMARRANPAFAVGAVAVPVAALAYALLMGTAGQHMYVHVMTGVIWTGTDLLMAAVLGPVLGGLDADQRAAVFERFTPKMTFLLPSLALVTIVGGVTLATRVTAFPHADAWVALFAVASTVPALLLVGWQFDAFRDRRWWAAFLLGGGGSVAYLVASLPEWGMTRPVFAVVLGIMVVLTVVGFGVLMPGEVRIYREMTSDDPDEELIGRIGMRNARLSGIQGAFQLAVIATMVYLRWGSL